MPYVYDREMRRKVYLPDDKEMAQAMAEIRAGWSDAEHERRARVFQRPEGAGVAMYSISHEQGRVSFTPVGRVQHIEET